MSGTLVPNVSEVLQAAASRDNQNAQSAASSSCDATPPSPATTPPTMTAFIPAKAPASNIIFSCLTSAGNCTVSSDDSDCVAPSGTTAASPGIFAQISAANSTATLCRASSPTPARAAILAADEPKLSSLSEVSSKGSNAAAAAAAVVASDSNATGAIPHHESRCRLTSKSSDASTSAFSTTSFSSTFPTNPLSSLSTCQSAELSHIATPAPTPLPHPAHIAVPPKQAESNGINESTDGAGSSSTVENDKISSNTPNTETVRLENSCDAATKPTSATRNHHVLFQSSSVSCTAFATSLATPASTPLVLSPHIQTYGPRLFSAVAADPASTTAPFANIPPASTPSANAAAAAVAASAGLVNAGLSMPLALTSAFFAPYYASIIPSPVTTPVSTIATPTSVAASIPTSQTVSLASAAAAAAAAQQGSLQEQLLVTQQLLTQQLRYQQQFQQFNFHPPYQPHKENRQQNTFRSPPPMPYPQPTEPQLTPAVTTVPLPSQLMNFAPQLQPPDPLSVPLQPLQSPAACIMTNSTALAERRLSTTDLAPLPHPPARAGPLLGFKPVGTRTAGGKTIIQGQQPFLQKRMPPQIKAGFPYVSSVLDTSGEKFDELEGGCGPLRKKPRSRTTPEQWAHLMRAFERNMMPSPAERNALAERINMHPRTVQVWFQNRRAKVRATNKKGIPVQDMDVDVVAANAAAAALAAPGTDGTALPRTPAMVKVEAVDQVDTKLTLGLSAPSAPKPLNAAAALPSPSTSMPSNMVTVGPRSANRNAPTTPASTSSLAMTQSSTPLYDTSVMSMLEPQHQRQRAESMTLFTVNKGVTGTLAPSQPRQPHHNAPAPDTIPLMIQQPFTALPNSSPTFALGQTLPFDPAMFPRGYLEAFTTNFL